MNERRSKCMQTHVNIQQRGGRPSGKDCVILLVVCQLIVSFLVSVLIGRVRKSRCVREKCSPSYLFSGGHASCIEKEAVLRPVGSETNKNRPPVSPRGRFRAFNSTIPASPGEPHGL